MVRGGWARPDPPRRWARAGPVPVHATATDRDRYLDSRRPCPSHVPGHRRPLRVTVTVTAMPLRPTRRAVPVGLSRGQLAGTALSSGRRSTAPSPLGLRESESLLHAGNPGFSVRARLVMGMGGKGWEGVGRGGKGWGQSSPYKCCCQCR